MSLCVSSFFLSLLSLVPLSCCFDLSLALSFFLRPVSFPNPFPYSFSLDLSFDSSLTFLFLCVNILFIDHVFIN